MRTQGWSGRNLGCGFPLLSLMHSYVPSDWGKFYTGGMRSQYSTAFSGQSSMYDCITSKPHQHIITSKIPIYNIGYHGCDWDRYRSPMKYDPSSDSWQGCWVKDHNPNQPHGPSGPVTQWLSRRWAWWNRTRMAAAWSPRTSLEVDKRIQKILRYMIVIPVTDQKQRTAWRFFGFCRVVEFIWCTGFQHFRKVNTSNSIEVSPDRMDYESVQGISG